MDKPTRVLPKTTPGQLVDRILEEPELLDAVRLLPARALGKLIDHVGLEDCGELVSLATTDQLREVFDEDLWRSERPGEQETFDAERFLLWLEVMLEVGERFAADKLSELPEELIALALDHHLLVVDIDALAIEMSGRVAGEISLTEKALESCLYYELDEYRVIARQHDGWDAIVSLLVELHARHNDLLQRLLRRLAFMSAEVCEREGGLYNVLTSAEMLEQDVAGDREDRRLMRGYVAPTTAKSFLALIRITPLTEIAAQVGSTWRDPITRAYFRSVERSTPSSDRHAAAAQSRAAGNEETPPSPERSVRLVEVLRDAEVLPDNREVAGLLAGGDDSGGADELLISRCLSELQGQAPEVYDQRREELAYLANLLVAGCSVGGERFRPVEAARAAVAVCNLALDYLVAQKGGSDAPRILSSEPADRLFRLGWRLLHQLTLDTADAVATRLERGDDKNPRLRFAARVLREAASAGKPWQEQRRLDPAGPAAEVFDPPLVETLRGLLGEYPMMLLSQQGPLEHISTVARLSRAREKLRSVVESA